MSRSKDCGDPHTEQLIEEAEEESVEEVCMISFISTEGNGALIKLLEGTFAGREAGHRRCGRTDVRAIQRNRFPGKTLVVMRG